MFRRLRALFARVFSGTPSPPPAGHGAGRTPDVDYAPDLDTTTDVFLAGWSIEATARTGSGADPYTGRLPDYVHTTGGRVIVAFTHPSGDKTYRTIHGPVTDEEQIADLILRTITVVSPV